MLDNTTASQNVAYNKYKYAYDSLNSATVDLNRMKISAEYYVSLPRYVRQIPKLTKLKAGTHSGPIKLVVDKDTMDNAVQDKEYLIGVNKGINKLLTEAGNYDWSSDIDIDVDTGLAITAFTNPIKIYVE